MLRTSGARNFVPEYRFHPTRKWRLDFAWPQYLIGVEIEGGIWHRGRHNRPAGFIEDCRKYNEAALMGWTIIRVPVADGQLEHWSERLEELIESRGRWPRALPPA